MAYHDGPTRDASSSRASFSSIREEAPPVEDGARPTIDYINNVIDGLLQAPLLRRPIELDAGNGARPLDTEREILASMLGRHSTGDVLSTKDLPDRLTPRIGTDVPAELDGESLQLMPELGKSTPPRSVYSDLGPYSSPQPSPTPAYLPLKANDEAPKEKFARTGPLIRHDESFSPPEPRMISVMLGRPLPSIPESAVHEIPIRAEASNVLLPTVRSSNALDHKDDSDPEALIHPAFRSKKDNAPLRLFRGASAFIDTASFDESGGLGVARPGSSHDVQSRTSVLDRRQHNHLEPPARRHHYSRSTSDLGSRNPSGYPPRQSSLMPEIGRPNLPRRDSNALGIYLTGSSNDLNDSDILSHEPLQRSRHSVQIPRSTGFDDLLAAQVDQNWDPFTSRPSIVDRSHSTEVRRLAHNEGVSQFNREHGRSLGPSRNPPVRPARPFSQSINQAPASILHPQRESSILHPYPPPWQAYPAPRHAYPQPPASTEEEDDAASTQAEADSINHDTDNVHLYQPSAVDRIAAVMSSRAMAASVQQREENIPSLVRERISRDFVDNAQRPMRRASRAGGGMKKAFLGLFGKDKDGR
ncbi:hypothetical protein MMC07_004357 [Pseudocyphellaria aurata]|nr:hypothetical protein [Pseudocyphellaria aurata]